MRATLAFNGLNLRESSSLNLSLQRRVFCCGIWHYAMFPVKNGSFFSKTQFPKYDPLYHINPFHATGFFRFYTALAVLIYILSGLGYRS